MGYVTDETWQNDTGKRWKATETENTRKGKNLNPEFLEPPLSNKIKTDSHSQRT